MLKSGQLSHQVHAVETENSGHTNHHSSFSVSNHPSCIRYVTISCSCIAAGKFDIMPPLTKIKDALSLAGKANQVLNQFRKNMTKPYLSPQFAILADISDGSKNFLFGDSIADTVEPLRKENQTKSLLRDKTNLKRKHPQSQQEPPNYQTSSKSQKRNSDHGQKQRRSVKSFSRI